MTRNECQIRKFLLTTKSAARLAPLPPPNPTPPHQPRAQGARGNANAAAPPRPPPAGDLSAASPPYASVHSALRVRATPLSAAVRSSPSRSHGRDNDGSPSSKHIFK
uniref:Uncharacterized protein n=1 Tax=Leersia perrieri TaxID=77586 RepID=A0A0D9WCR3_9ORYZ